MVKRGVIELTSEQLGVFLKIPRGIKIVFAEKVTLTNMYRFHLEGKNLKTFSEPQFDGLESPKQEQHYKTGELF